MADFTMNNMVDEELLLTQGPNGEDFGKISANGHFVWHWGPGQAWPPGASGFELTYASTVNTYTVSLDSDNGVDPGEDVVLYVFLNKVLVVEDQRVVQVLDPVG